MSAKEIMTGNEAIARGAYEAGVTVGTAYPGTPSTEILETLARYKGIHCNWSVNEKVALEVGIGASLAGARVITCMKHVGVNVAADPLVTFSYTGVGGGLVLVAADDPGMHSSQNEQDSRHLARLAKIPVLEPADSQEAKDFVLYALELSERFDTPVLLRSSTRISHSRGLVALGEPLPREPKEYVKNAPKYVMLPAYARRRHPLVEARLQALQEEAEKSPLNRIEAGSPELGVVCSGVAYQYVKEALPDASVLKLGFSYPLPAGLVRRFAAAVKRLLVVEELDPFMEEQIRALGLEVTGKELFPAVGEYSTELIREKVRGESRGTIPPREIPSRPPLLCPGCSHRGVFYVLKQLKVHVMGDIGCYTLAATPPLEAMDSCICMGASIGTALGMVLAKPELAGRTVAVIGDSTFLHSGITPLIDVVYNAAPVTVLILDNGTTAMTGHQAHPGTGFTLQGKKVPAVDLEALCRAVGVRRVAVVDPFQLDRLRQTLKEELAAGEPSVIIARHPCPLLTRESSPPLAVKEDQCNGCRLCLRLGCPAISFDGKKAAVNPSLCNGCGLCAQVCRQQAIIPVSEEGR